MSAEPEEARDFAKAYRQFLAWVHQEETHGGTAEVVALVRDHLTGEAMTRSVVRRELANFEHVNLQVALDAWTVEDGRRAEVHGLTVPPHYGPVSLQQLIHGDALPPIRLSAPDLVDIPSGPGRTIACLRRALLLVEDRRGSYAVLLLGPDRQHDQGLSLEIAGLATVDAQEVLGELDALRSRLNIYRGQVLEIVAGDMGFSIEFPVLPRTERADVVLPESVLRRIERHTLDIGRHREALQAAGQHLKRGLLLYGPPGAGKTHTTRYVVQQLVGTTVLLLSGRSLHFIGNVTAMARELQPSAVVLEDVDLVAEDRGYGPGPSPVLFSLLDAMDGAAADADLLFLLTTNRADLLEPALAARPGRVDVAIEIELPAADARRRLFEVYSRSLPLVLTETEIDDVVERTAGVTASFVKELLRRAALEAIAAGDGSLHEVTGADVSRALDDLLDSGQAVTRALLGVQDGSEPGPATPGRDHEGHRGVGWLRGGTRYRSAPHYYTDGA
jgi:cell division protease FtsH